VEGFRRMDKYGLNPRAAQGGNNFLSNMAGLPDSGYDDLTGMV